MSVSFQISALPAEQFRDLFALNEDALARLGAKRCVADTVPGYPCRVSLRDAEVGEELILLPIVYHNVNSPYRASGPVFVCAGAEQARPGVSEVPNSVRQRLLSVRAYDALGFLVDAEVIDGQQLETLVEKFFADNQMAYLHLHNARPGCYSCRVDRVLPAMQETG